MNDECESLSGGKASGAPAPLSKKPNVLTRIFLIGALATAFLTFQGTSLSAQDDAGRSNGTATGSEPHSSMDPIAARGIERCMGCHGAFGGNFSNLSPDEIYAVLRHGAMQEMASGLDDGTLRAIAERLGDPAAVKRRPPSGGASMCGKTEALDAGASNWAGWSSDATNARHAEVPLSNENLGKAELRWAFGFPDTGVWSGAGTPIAAAGGRLYVGSTNRWFYAIDAKTGCTRWARPTKGWIRSAAAVSDGVVVVGDNIGWVYGFDAESGRLLWRDLGDDQVNARISGSITIAAGRAYVPYSAMEDGLLEMMPALPCCTFSGSVAAFDIHSGERLWNSRMLDGPVRSLGKTKDQVDRYGPSGAAIWAPPTVDLRRGLVYVGTSHQMTGPAQPEGIAIVALDLRTGTKRWATNFADDMIASMGSNASETARDGDVGAAPVLVKRSDGKDVILVGTKESIVYALDPDAAGRILWRAKIGRGGGIGGVTYGMATDGVLAYAPLHDLDELDFGEHGPARTPAKDAKDAVSTIVALDLMTGKIVWKTPVPTDGCAGKERALCRSAFFGPATLIGDVVLAGGNDGVMRGFDKKTGRLTWSYDTVRPFKTINGVEAKGGSFSMGGAVFADGMLYLNSGLGILNAALPGNALIALSVPGSGKTAALAVK